MLNLPAENISYDGGGAEASTWSWFPIGGKAPFLSKGGNLLLLSFKEGNRPVDEFPLDNEGNCPFLSLGGLSVNS